jgi:hypothetical protein
MVDFKKFDQADEDLLTNKKKYQDVLQVSQINLCLDKIIESYICKK